MFRKCRCDPAAAGEEMAASTFWVHDESRRYPTPASPDTFFIMGTGFDILWFGIAEDGEVLAAGGFPIGNRPLKDQVRSQPSPQPSAQ